MAIGALTDHVAGQIMNLATLVGNNTLIEQYIAGLIDPADFQDLVTKAHGVRGQHHRVYIGTPFDANINPGSHHIRTYDVVSEEVNTIATPTELDLKSELDISMINAAYGWPASALSGTGIWSNASWQNDTGLTSRRTCLLWERLGVNPVATGGVPGYPNPLKSYEHSWHNWRWDGDLLSDIPGLTDPLGVDTYVYENYLFSQQDDSNTHYYDRWMTVPHCSKRIWIPEPCTLLVIASAYGTCNSSLGGRVDGTGGGAPPYGEDLSANSGTWPDGHVGPQTDRSNEFRLFIDSDGRPVSGSPVFAWKCGEAKTGNHRTLSANWIPHTNTGDQPTTGINITSMPRSRFTLAHEFVIPAAGYYNISMRYSANYFYGALMNHGGGTPLTASWNEYYAGYGMADHWIARWEHAQIGALAIFGQTTIENDASDDHLNTYAEFNLT